MIHTVDNLIERAGGYAVVAAACTEKPVTEDAVRKWRLNGIPEIHWPVFIKRVGVSPSDIYSANCALRRHRSQRQSTVAVQSS